MTKAVNILVVDDNIEFADGLADILKEKGYDATAVYSSESAVALVKERPFGFIFLDIKMPHKNGVDTFKEIKEINPDIKVIIMTAFSVDDLIKEALKEGAYGIIYKPIDIDKAVKLIAKNRNKGCLILIVDDDANTRETLKDLLEKEGHTVTLAKDGQEAMAKAMECPQHVVFIDMRLPVINGLELYLSLKEITPTMVAVIMTAFRHEMKGLVKEALSKSAYACLYKPFDPEDVINVIKEICDGENKKA